MRLRQRSIFPLGMAIALLLNIVPRPAGLAQTPPNQIRDKPPRQTNKKKSEAPSPTDQEIDPNDVIRINTTLVNSPVLIIGRNGKFVPNLTRDDFQIFENGVPQEIANFAPVEKPFTVVLLIDTSRSTLSELQDIQSAAISFVDKMRSDDQAIIVSFSGKINVLAEATSDREALKRAIQSCRPEGNSRVYDAISFVLGQRLARVRGRTAVIIFSDGVDNDSRDATFESTLKSIAQTQSLIYPVQFSTFEYMEGSTRPVRRPAPEGSGFSQADYVRADAFLHQAADLSSTGVYPASNISDLDYAVANIVDELHNEYSVGYYPRTPPQPGEARQVEIRTKFPQLVVRARTSYSIDRSGNALRIVQTNNQQAQPTSNPIGAIPLRRSSDDSKSSLNERWMCKGTDAPTDFVVVKEGVVSYCPKSERPKDETNAWLLRRPADREIMCKGFIRWRGMDVAAAPIPTGYVVTSQVTSLTCSKSSDPENVTNAWTIHKPTGRDTVCKGFTIPRGFVMVNEVEVTGCPATTSGKNGWIIRPK